MRLKGLDLGIDLFGFSGKVSWEPDESERLAAWELYVEMVTRIAVARLDSGSGSLREALDSYHALFRAAREILRKYGPSVAKPRGGGNVSFGYLTLWLLNRELRPLLAEWHPKLSDYEARRAAAVSAIAHEQAWPEAAVLRSRMDQASVQCERYARWFESIVDIPSLLPERPPQ
jgi:hypothetical protein